MAAERLEDFDMASSAEAPPCRWVAMAAERLEDFDRSSKTSTRAVRRRQCSRPLVAMAAERLEDFDGIWICTR